MKEIAGPEGEYGKILRQRPVAWISNGVRGADYDCSMLLVSLLVQTVQLFVLACKLLRAVGLFEAFLGGQLIRNLLRNTHTHTTLSRSMQLDCLTWLMSQQLYLKGRPHTATARMVKLQLNHMAGL